MGNINKQIDELRQLFGVKNIFSRTKLDSLTNEMQLEVIEVIKNNKKDGVYPVCGTIQVVLINGKCVIQDRNG